MTIYRTVKVHLKGNAYYPNLYIIRDGIQREYPVNERRFKWMQELFDSHRGRIFVDMENSYVELTKEKG